MGQEVKVMDGQTILDLTNEFGDHTTKLLSYFGAEIIRVESPGGDPTRNIGPFWKNRVDREHSLHWFTRNINKKSITLDIESEDGKALFKQLAKQSHFVVECKPVGYLDKLGLGYDDIVKINPSIIWLAISPFGETGPYRNFKGSPIVIDALSGHLYTVGENLQRPPVQASFPEVELHTAVQAAAGAMLAYYHRLNTGEGQKVVVSAQEAASVMNLPHLMAWKSHKYPTLRDYAGPRRPEARRMNADVFKCKDGYVFCYATAWPDRKRMREWLKEEKLEGKLYEAEWTPIFEEGGWMNMEQRNYINAQVQLLCDKHTRKEVFEMAQGRMIQAVQLGTVADVAVDPHLKAREAWSPVEHPELGMTIQYLRPPIRCSEMSCELSHRAPFVGENNEEIYSGRLGLTPLRLAQLKSAGVI
jgi:crotonobetainyl-CoA:carnitine CoA-transferase CaiB-like acyl-CoA transferase